MKLYRYIIMSIAAISLGACSEDVMDEINKDKANPAAELVPAKYQITDAIMSTGFSTTSGDYSFYLASLMEQELGVGNNQLMKAEMRNSSEWAASTTFNNVWNSTYGTIMNLRQIEQKIQDEVPGNTGQYDLLGMAQVLEALNFGILTDMHGDIPYSEAARGQEFLQPKVEPQKDIYAGIIKTLDDAIANLTKGIGLSSVAGQDIAFANNNEMWIATAHALKARYYIHQSAVDPSVIAKAEAEAQQAVDMGFDGFKITEFNGVTCDNPWSAYYWSRYYTASSSTVADIMEATGDPRYEIYTYWSGEAYPPGDQAIAEVADGSLAAPAWLDLGAQPVNLVNAAEPFFILAECQARQGKDASEAYQAGVEASIDEFAALYGMFGEGIDSGDFFDAIGEPTLENIFTQKYISQIIDQQTEAYNDYRRLQAMGETYIRLANPNNTQSGVNRFPYLLPYGNSSVLSNPNIAKLYGDGSYIYTQKSWVNGGK